MTSTSKAELSIFLWPIMTSAWVRGAWVEVELEKPRSGNEAGRKKTNMQKWSRQKCSPADMFAEGLPIQMPT